MELMKKKKTLTEGEGEEMTAFHFPVNKHFKTSLRHNPLQPTLIKHR